jgi:hypothetical protein
MARLRMSVMADIEEKLSRSYFGRGSFGVTYPDNGNSYCVVGFLPLPGYQCKLADAGNGFTVTYSPGRVRETEEVVLGTSQFGDLVVQWTERVKQDLLHPVTVDDELKEFTAKLEEELKAKSKSGNTKAPFTAAEVADLTAKLEEMSTKLEALQQRQAITEAELQSLQEILNGAKRDLQSYPRGVWLRVTATRLWETTKAIITSPEGRQILSGELKKLIGLDGGPTGTS